MKLIVKGDKMNKIRFDRGGSNALQFRPKGRIIGNGVIGFMEAANAVALTIASARDGSKIVDCNTVMNISTHFLNPVELIKSARTEYNIASENWPCPTRSKLGTPSLDGYYCEVWQDGMDWQHTYWLLEQVKTNAPVALPFIRFDKHEEEDKFNLYDFENMINAILFYRRNDLWIRDKDVYGIFSDTVWPYFHFNKILSGQSYFQNYWSRNYYFKHASQPRVEFEVNTKLLPISKRYQSD